MAKKIAALLLTIGLLCLVSLLIAFPSSPVSNDPLVASSDTQDDQSTEPDEPGVSFLTSETISCEDTVGSDTSSAEKMFFSEEILSDDPAPTCRKCQDNKDNHLGNTLDKCIVAGKGNVCNGATEWKKKKCCDWTDTSQSKCACNTKVAGPCPDDNNACTCCMMLAEAANENNNTCKAAVYCVMKKRADDANVGMCKANSMKVGKGDTASFTSDKCTCDRQGTGGGAYNQTYCNCREAICNAGGDTSAWPGCQAMLNIANGATCSSFGGINSYQVGRCPRGCTVAGPSGCKHTFCKC